MRLALYLAVFGSMGCLGDNNVGWVAFNDSDQVIDVPVTVSTEPGEDATLDLFSTTGTVDVGEAAISPGSGPVGTVHTVQVDVLDDFEEDVGRVTVEISSDRGEQTQLLIQDSADHGRWQLELTSLGAEGEERTDSFRVRLWRAAETDEEADPEAETEEP